MKHAFFDLARRGMTACALGILAAVAWAGPTPAVAEDLVVYTALEDDQLTAYKEAFESANPGITINWVRDSTGPITARLLAEKDNRQADVVWGLAATSLLVLDAEGMLEGYAPAGIEKIKPGFRDAADQPKWVGMDAWASALCYNVPEGQAKGVPQPTSWADLLNPEYKGHVVMPNPASSGTGYLTVSAILQLMGEEKGWTYLDGLHENISTYLHSGSKPCVNAAKGEFVVGISFAYRGVQEKNKGAPIEIILPSEGIGWDMEATAILNGTDNPDAAKKLADFAASAAANQLYAKSYSVTAHPDISGMIENYPANEEQLMIKNDFTWAAVNRERILEEWKKRYDLKSAPKS
ncbi:MAG: putative 2-aminoethylphosphonate ABC transporter substrate-binding protein [Dongiaceae bacterium]